MSVNLSNFYDYVKGLMSVYSRHHTTPGTIYINGHDLKILTGEVMGEYYYNEKGMSVKVEDGSIRVSKILNPYTGEMYPVVVSPEAKLPYIQ